MNPSTTETVEQALDRLADRAATSDERDQVRRSIVGLGKGAIPGLLAHLEDSRVVERRDAANRQGLPPHLPPPAPIWVDHTVGQACRGLLYAVITPALAAAVARPSKPYSTSVLRVDDWKKWWAHNQHKSLERIHVELRPLVERWHATHGTEQVVPLEPCLVVRKMSVPHCARGPARCAKCRAATAEKHVLIDICPEGEAARPTVEVRLDGKTTWRTYDVVRVFASEDEAHAWAREHGQQVESAE